MLLASNQSRRIVCFGYSNAAGGTASTAPDKGWHKGKNSAQARRHKSEFRLPLCAQRNSQRMLVPTPQLFLLDPLPGVIWAYTIGHTREIAGLAAGCLKQWAMSLEHACCQEPACHAEHGAHLCLRRQPFAQHVVQCMMIDVHRLHHHSTHWAGT